MAAGGMVVLTGKKGYTLIEGGSATNDSKTIGYLPEDWNGLFVESTFYVSFDHTSAAGTVLIESAPSSDYAGTWVTEATVAWAAIDKTHRVSINAILGAVRARISSAVTSGTVTVKAWVSTNS